MTESRTSALRDVDPVEFARRNQIFAAPADDPRQRRPVDALMFGAAILGVALCGWLYESRANVDERVLSLFADMPSWVSGVAVAVFALAGLYGLALIVGVTFFGRGRLAIVRDMLFAAVLAIGGVIVFSYAFGSGFPRLVPELTSTPEYPDFPVVRLSAALAAIGVAKPFLSLPMRKFGNRLLAGSSIAALLLGYGTFSAVLGGLFVGAAAASAVHLMFGSGSGIPSRSRIMAALVEAGVEVTDIEYLPEQPTGATIVRATETDDTSLLVKIYGRDAADLAFATRLWRAVWYRGESGGLFASRLQLAEHEALVLLLLERAEVPAVRLISGAKASTDDVVLVTQWADGRRLEKGGAVDDAALDELWETLKSLQAAGVAHGSIGREQIVFTTGGPILTDLRSADLVADQAALAGDRAQLMVATALDLGADRALDAACRSLSDEALVETIPLLQTGILPTELQSDIRSEKFDVDELRAGLAERLDVEEPELAQLYRVTWGSVAMVALTAFAAYSLITSLTEIGFDSIADQYATAIWGWIAVAFILAQLTNVGEYLTLAGVIGRPVPFGPTMMFRYAISFISLAVPSDAGAIAMSVRFQQKLGVPAAAAIAQGPLLTIFSKGFDLILLVLTAQFVTRTVDTDDVDFGPVVKLVGLIIVIAVIAILVTALTPKLRARMMPHLKEGFTAIKGSLTDPQRLGKIAMGTLLQKVLFAIALSASVSAFGGDLSFGAAVFVNTAVSLFVGLVPVPGGIGVGESALTAGLIAVGIPPEAAAAAAITHRMVTSYLPPVFGWWASRWLTQRDYL